MKRKLTRYRRWISQEFAAKQDNRNAWQIKSVQVFHAFLGDSTFPDRLVHNKIEYLSFDLEFVLFGKIQCLEMFERHLDEWPCTILCHRNVDSKHFYPTAIMDHLQRPFVDWYKIVWSFHRNCTEKEQNKNRTKLRNPPLTGCDHIASVSAMIVIDRWAHRATKTNICYEISILLVHRWWPNAAIAPSVGPQTAGTSLSIPIWQICRTLSNQWNKLNRYLLTCIYLVLTIAHKSMIYFRLKKFVVTVIWYFSQTFLVIPFRFGFETNNKFISIRMLFGWVL